MRGMAAPCMSSVMRAEFALQSQTHVFAAPGIQLQGMMTARAGLLQLALQSCWTVPIVGAPGPDPT